MIIEIKDDLISLQKSFPHYFEKREGFKEEPFRHYLAYKIQDTIVAILIYSIIYERMEIDQLEVKKDYQNQQIATKLLEKVIWIAIKQRLENITLEVKSTNQKAIHLYQKVGFQIVAKRKGYYHEQGQMIDGYLMEKEVIK